MFAAPRRQHRSSPAVIAAAALLSLLGGSAQSAPEKGIVGTWLTADKNGKLAVFEEAPGTFAARVVAVPVEAAEKVDKNNPDPARRTQRILGTVVLSGFRPDGKGEYTGGKAYDPDSGKSYDAKIWLEGDKTLKIRGFLGISLLGRTETFSRVDDVATTASTRERKPNDPRLVQLSR